VETSYDESSTVVHRAARSEPSQTRLSSDLMNEAGDLRGQARTLHYEGQDIHRETTLHTWTQRTAEQGKRGTQDLLDDLHELGFAWRDIARMVGVTVPALQKWRRGQRPSGENKSAIAGLLAACHLIQERYLVEDLASWFEMPVVPGYPVTPIEMYARGGRVLVFDHASGHASPEEVLDVYEPDWRSQYSSPYTIYRAEDGHLSIGIETV
jgi:transcriptional regulator with XRE-family HTH domain